MKPDYDIDVTIAPEDLAKPTAGGLKNKPEREEWFRDLGLGLFIN